MTPQVARLGDQREQAIQLDVVFEKVFGSAQELGEVSLSSIASSVSKRSFHLSVKVSLRTCQGITGSVPRHIRRWENLVFRWKSILRTAGEKLAICRSSVRSPILLDQKYAQLLAPHLTSLRKMFS